MVLKNNIKIVFSLFFAISFMSCKAQLITINAAGNNSNLPANYLSSGQYYKKDLNNYLINFEGTWEYTNGNEKFQLILTKVTQYHHVNGNLNFNFYKDGIIFKYKKFINNILVFESPTQTHPTISAYRGDLLEGNIIDFERTTVNVYYPQAIGGGLQIQGGEYFRPNCIIERIDTPRNEPKKIKMKLLLTDGYGRYSNPAYTNLPQFSIPNNIILTKI